MRPLIFSGVLLGYGFFTYSGVQVLKTVVAAALFWYFDLAEFEPYALALSFAFKLPMLAVLYAVFERVVKEYWVIGDSFRRSHRILLDSLEANPRPLMVTDAQGNFLYFNEATQQSFINNAEGDTPTNVFSLI